jgi:phosphoribosyl 1,2-cyclic phosphodiesterase
MLRACVLGSGSKGNATWLEREGGAAVLLDAGLGPRALESRIKAAGRHPDQLAAIFLTHEHGDHIAGLEAFSLKHKIPVYASEKLCRGHEALRSIPARVGLKAGREVEVAGFRVTPVPVPHDALDPFAFHVEAGEQTFGYLTDIGHPSAKLAGHFDSCDILYLEFNHDKGMLENGPYESWLKARVGGDKGHLSNAQAAEILSGMLSPRCSDVFLAHLSEVNNAPSLAEESARRACEARRCTPRLHVASQREPTAMIPAARDGRLFA